MTATAKVPSAPKPGEYAEFYAKYVALVPESNIIEVLESQLKELVEFLRSVPEAHVEVLHPPYTWTIKQVVNHLTDGERVFGYRALRIGRCDSTPLPGFDENEFARSAQVDRIPLGDLILDFEAVRAATLSLLRNLPVEAWQRTGTANGSPISVRALAWIMAGHVRHHLAIMRKRLGR